MAIPAGIESVPFMITLVAALQMAAENCGAAHFNRVHDAPLPNGHRRAMLFAIGFTIAAKDIRHFQLRAIQ